MTVNQNTPSQDGKGFEPTAEQRAVMREALKGLTFPLPRGPMSPGLGDSVELEVGIREQAISATSCIIPEMSTFDDGDEAYFARFFATAERIAAWIRHGA